MCGKNIVTEEIQFWKVEITQTCMLPYFFDVVAHLFVHLLEEVELAGLVHSRWLYFFQRCMKTLKSSIRQKIIQRVA